jgi:hypothetical protein
MTGATINGGDRREWPLVAALVGAGILVRLAWLARTSGGITGFAGGGEAARVALTLAREGRFGDAFWPGSGPTAHLMPVAPSIAATVFRVFPPESAAASLTLLAWALAQWLAGVVLLRVLFARLGASFAARLWGSALVLLAPVYYPEETIGFRYWENGLAACIAVGSLILAFDVEQARRLPAAKAIGVAILWAATCFTHPIVGFALALVWAWVALRRLPFGEAARFAALCAAMLALVLVPWTLRNARALGEPVPLRSNFGLEFAIGNHPAAVSGAEPAQVYADRLAAIHPLYGGPARAAFVRAGGEVRYARALGHDAWSWAHADPLDFARLTVRHLSQFVFPRPWQFLSSAWEEWLIPRAWLLSFTNLLGLAAIMLEITRRRPGAVLLAVFVAGVALPYALVQPMPRYTYVIWGLLAFAAADGIARWRSGAAKPR